jgi:hypothetical protein
MKKVNGLYEGIKPLIGDVDKDYEFNKEELEF